MEKVDYPCLQGVVEIEDGKCLCCGWTCEYPNSHIDHCGGGDCEYIRNKYDVWIDEDGELQWKKK